MGLISGIISAEANSKQWPPEGPETPQKSHNHNIGGQEILKVTAARLADGLFGGKAPKDGFPTVYLCV